MKAFPRIFFQVDTIQLDPSLPRGSPDRYESPLTNGCGMLRDLVSFGEIGVEIILSGKIIVPLNLAMAGQPHFDGEFHRFFIQFRQCTGMTEGHRTNVRIGLPSECSAIAAEQ